MTVKLFEIPELVFSYTGCRLHDFCSRSCWALIGYYVAYGNNEQSDWVLEFDGHRICQHQSEDAAIAAANAHHRKVMARGLTRREDAERAIEEAAK